MGYIPSMTPGERAQWAILQEVSAIKAGNVHPNAPFADMNWDHFLRAANAIGSAIDATSTAKLGTTIHACAHAMLASVGVNTSLGTILLVVPLAKVESMHGVDRFTIDRCSQSLEQVTLSDSLMELLSKTDAFDSAHIYDAISTCKPGGIGKSDRMDVRNAPPDSILDAMQLASAWDDIALQYCNGFEQVIGYAHRLQELAPELGELACAIRRLQGEVLAQRADSLIVRKHGAKVGEQVRSLAHTMLLSGPYGSNAYESSWGELDRFLRQPDARKNPGTTADLIAAALYVASSKWT